jgi:hypothetical protein
MAKPEYSIELTAADRQGGGYKKLQKHILHILERERARNDAVGLAPETTGCIRGRISLCKELIKLDEVGTEIEIENDE